MVERNHSWAKCDSMKAEDIFLAALDKQTLAQRMAYLDTACGDDAGGRAQVAGLLHSHEEAGSFLQAPLFDSPPTIDRSASSTAPHATAPDKIPLDFLAPAESPDALGQIGPYEVMETI